MKGHGENTSSKDRMASLLGNRGAFHDGMFGAAAIPRFQPCP